MKKSLRKLEARAKHEKDDELRDWFKELLDRLEEKPKRVKHTPRIHIVEDDEEVCIEK